MVVYHLFATLEEKSTGVGICTVGKKRFIVPICLKFKIIPWYREANEAIKGTGGGICITAPSEPYK